jgi:hypothetical protein
MVLVTQAGSVPAGHGVIVGGGTGATGPVRRPGAVVFALAADAATGPWIGPGA